MPKGEEEEAIKGKLDQVSPKINGFTQNWSNIY